MGRVTCTLFLAFVALADGSIREFTNPKTNVSYVYESVSRDYHQAKAFCEEEYDSLAMPKTIDDNRFIAQQINSMHVDVWIGLEPFGNGSTPAVWLDGTPLKSWSSHRKNIGRAQCNAVLLSISNAYWWVNGCKYGLASALCQKDGVQVVDETDQVEQGKEQAEKLNQLNNEINSLKQSVVEKNLAIGKFNKALINERVIVSQLRNEIKQKDTDCNERIVKILNE